LQQALLSRQKRGTYSVFRRRSARRDGRRDRQSSPAGSDPDRLATRQTSTPARHRTGRQRSTAYARSAVSSPSQSEGAIGAIQTSAAQVKPPKPTTLTVGTHFVRTPVEAQLNLLSAETADGLPRNEVERPLRQFRLVADKSASRPSGESSL
jgi:hypothetical protein